MSETFAYMNQYIDFPALGTLLGLALLLLALRYMAFGRVESSAIDISLFSFAYVAIAMLEETSTDLNSKHLLFSGLFLVASVLLHAYLRERLKRKIKRTVARLKPNLKDDELRLVDSFANVLEWSVDVALVIKQKPGKEERRKELIEVFAKANLDPAQSLDPQVDLLLPAGLRKWMLAAFIVLGTISILIPTIRGF